MNRLLLLGIITYLLAIVGLLTLNGTMVALVVPLVFFLGASLLYGPAEPHLTIQRSLSAERVSEGNQVDVTLSITNVGSKIELFLVKDTPPPELEIVEGDPDLLCTLQPGETALIEYSLLARRGRYQFGSIWLEISDYLGVFRHLEWRKLEETSEFFVMPTVSTVDRIPIRPRQTKAFAGYIPARLGGPGTEFFGVRGYQRGDSLRHINWRANARNPGKIFTNEYEQERVADVGIILDARQRSHVQIGADSLFDFSVKAAAALADSFINDANRVGLLRYGDFLDWTLPGYGKIQRERIMQSLAKARPGESMVFDQFENLPSRFFPPKSQIVLVSPLLSEDANALIRLRSRGYSVLVVSPDPVSFEMSLTRDTPLAVMSARIARLERALLFQKVRAAGVQMIEWDVRQPFEQSVTPQLRRYSAAAAHMQG
ncbi:MAG: DUF58 domain-containing protein [Anaerolineales bacterium]|nr:DUF58 domain-containing protein [Anaerolineales bacterium]MCB0005052.1 DUF58 domain-containing protein [Anaerolineales bacterium]MCB0014472.1 DUF58 domain-containing protein [Anaerolineales bacterium]MCB0020642.1 DUF58 domain-containing protein [Anaerolineales bacterium]